MVVDMLIHPLTACAKASARLTPQGPAARAFAYPGSWDIQVPTNELEKPLG